MKLKLFKIKFIAGSLNSNEVTRLYNKELEESAIVTAEKLFNYRIVDLDNELKSGENSSEVSETFISAMTTIVDIGWFYGTHIGARQITPYNKNKNQSLYQTTVNNPNIMASNASFQNQSMLEQQRFEHRMMLERAREQSRVPGPQNIDQGGYGGVDPYKRNPSSAFSDADMMGIARGIYGSGMRL